MNYKRIYDNLILKAKARIITEGYTEDHHIIPTSEGGQDIDDNIVTLTAKEHFVAHWLLYKDNTKSHTRASAFWMMCNVDPSLAKSRYIPPARIVALAREASAKAKSKLYKQKCWVHKETGEKLYIFKSEREAYLAEGWLFGNGRVISEETKQKLRDANLGKSQGNEFSKKMSDIVKKRYEENPEQWKRSDETKKKLSVLATEKWQDPERSAKMASKSRSKVTCPHCGKEGNAVVMPRWHFDNCKLKK